MKLEAAQLQQVYARFPSLKANADRSALATAAKEVLGAEPAKALLAALADEDTYLSARASALDALVREPPAPAPQQRRAVVFVGSAEGQKAAALLAKAGYHVDAIGPGDSLKLEGPDEAGRYSVPGLATPDLIVVDSLGAAPSRKGKTDASVTRMLAALGSAKGSAQSPAPTSHEQQLRGEASLATQPDAGRTAQRSTAGANVVVGNVGRLEALVFDLELGVEASAALGRYEQAALADARGWGKRGLVELKPEVAISDAHAQALSEWLAGNAKDPLAALERLLEPMSEALPAIGSPSAT